MPRPRLRTDALREEILQRAIAVLEEGGPLALRARDIASAAGTSTAALYELFGGKGDLVRAIFYEGFHRMRDALEGVPVTDDPRADVVNIFAAAREFALANPMLYSVMYARPFAEFDPDNDDREAGRALYRAIVQRVTRWIDAAGSGADPIDASHALVAAHRGLAASETAGVLGSTRANRDRRWRLTIDALLDGFESTRAVGKSRRR